MARSICFLILRTLAGVGWAVSLDKEPATRLNISGSPIPPKPDFWIRAF